MEGTWSVAEASRTAFIALVKEGSEGLSFVFSFCLLVNKMSKVLHMKLPDILFDSMKERMEKEEEEDEDEEGEEEGDKEGKEKE